MDKPANSTIINVCVIPSAEVGVECVGLSQALKVTNPLFVLDGASEFAHMTVFMARFADDNIPEVIKRVQAIMKEVAPFECEHVGYFLTSGRYLEISYRKSEYFMWLHESLISGLAPLRINPEDPYEEGYFTPYAPEQQQNAKETGYDLARGLYRPHITLTRWAEGKVPEIFPGFAPAKLSFRLSTVCVFKADDNGAVYEELAKSSI
jgi:2'-5' RNA ligase